MIITKITINHLEILFHKDFIIITERFFLKKFKLLLFKSFNYFIFLSYYIK